MTSPQSQQSIGPRRFSIWVCPCGAVAGEGNGAHAPGCKLPERVEVEYVRLDPRVPVVHHAVMLAEVERLQDIIGRLYMRRGDGPNELRKAIRSAFGEARAKTGKEPTDAAL